MKRHVTCFVKKAGFEPRTLGTKAERSIKILALNNTVMDLTAEQTKQEIRCEFVHHQLGVLPRLPLPLQVDELEHLIVRMCGMTQQVPRTSGSLSTTVGSHILQAGAARQPGL